MSLATSGEGAACHFRNGAGAAQVEQGTTWAGRLPPVPVYAFPLNLAPKYRAADRCAGYADEGPGKTRAGACKKSAEGRAIGMERTKG
jgi:hypothetical protein